MTSMNTFHFWINLQKNGDDLSDALVEAENNLTEDLARELFKSAKESISEANSFDKNLCFLDS